MLKDIKLGFKLLRYGYKLKLNVIMLVFFAVFGIASDIMSKGTTIIGGIYFMMSGMFTFQLIMSMDVSELIQSTSLKKKLQIYIPVMSSTVINLVIFTFLVVERVILIQYGVADKTQLIYTLFTLDVVLLIVYLYTSICYKYFVLGFIVFMVLFMGVFTVFSGAGADPESHGTALGKLPAGSFPRAHCICLRQRRSLAVYAQLMPVGLGSKMHTPLRKSTALRSPSSMVMTLSSCSIDSTRS